MSFDHLWFIFFPSSASQHVVCNLYSLGACPFYTPLGALLGMLYLDTVEAQKAVVTFKGVLSICLREDLIWEPDTLLSLMLHSASFCV